MTRGVCVEVRVGYWGAALVKQMNGCTKGFMFTGSTAVSTKGIAKVGFQ